MNIQKLNWAGIKINCGGKTILVDAVEDFSPYAMVLGQPQTPLVHFRETIKADYILFTHLHSDHYDVAVIQQCLEPGGKIIAYKKFEKAISKSGQPAVYLDKDEDFEENGIIFKPVFSCGGIGEDQVAWIVEYKNYKIFHAGDTIWHNRFWQLGKENPGINLAFLPVNGVVVDFTMMGLEYSSIPVSMSPGEAFNAAKLLHAQHLIPIHYKKFSTAYYQPKEIKENEFAELSVATGQSYRLLEDGQSLTNI